MINAFRQLSDLKSEEILDRLVSLNDERAREERSGLIRWLRPEYQNPDRTRQEVLTTDEGQEAEVKPAVVTRTKWPSTLLDQARAVRELLQTQNQIMSSQDVAHAFTGAKIEKVTELLETLVSLGQARGLRDGRYTT